MRLEVAGAPGSSSQLEGQGDESKKVGAVEVQEVIYTDGAKDVQGFGGEFYSAVKLDEKIKREVGQGDESVE